MPLGWFRRSPVAPAIDDVSWTQVREALGEVVPLRAEHWVRLRELAENFVRDKSFTGARGFEVTPLVRASIAAQACLPVLALGLGGYRDFVEIVIYPAQFRVPRRRTDEAGVVHETEEWLAGEAMDGGPVVLSWEDAAPGASQAGASVVVHEFVHKLDMLDGEADGVPPLPAGRRAAWMNALDAAYDDFCERLDAVERALPRHIDPESEAADPWFAALPLDPYAATDPAEFFAVSGEAFFVAPERLREAYPGWHAELAAFFRIEPGDELGRGEK
jgi:Mlc titration factor MtfA (ptsG expression regulator)